MRKEALLRLLLLHDELETVEAWAAALAGEGERCAVADALVLDEDPEGGGALLISVMDEVVPYLPDYSMVSAKLTALMCYVDETYSSQVNQLVQGWLQRAGHSVPFRKWIIRDWLKCSHLPSTDPVKLLQWRYALFVATMNETVQPLKRVLLGYVNAVNEVVEAQLESNKGAQMAPSAELQLILTVEELLDFCFLHAEQLASYSLLSAAKLHALAMRTQRSAVKLAGDDEVLVRLRWSLMLKPMLFKPLLQHAIALKTIPGYITASQCWTSKELAGLVELVDVTEKETIVTEMHRRRHELECAFASGAEHLHSKTKNRFVVEAAVGEYVQALSAEKMKLILAELERDLDEAPPHLFSYVFMMFGLILNAMLSSPAPEDQDLIVEAVSNLFALFDRRSHDATSCLDVLGLLVRLQLAAHFIWHDNAPLYLYTIESLFETTVLQVEPKLKWAARMALHQLLFECDVQLLQSNQSNLSKLLSVGTMRLISIRLGN